MWTAELYNSSGGKLVAELKLPHSVAVDIIVWQGRAFKNHQGNQYRERTAYFAAAEEPTDD